MRSEACGLPARCCASGNGHRVRGEDVLQSEKPGLAEGLRVPVPARVLLT